MFILTRQLMGLMNDESELALVLGHESDTCRRAPFDQAPSSDDAEHDHLAGSAEIDLLGRVNSAAVGNEIALQQGIGT